MPMMSVGDMAQQFTSLRNGGAIKTDLARLAQSLSTGKVADITRELDGQTTRFSGIRYRLEQLDAFALAASETSQLLANMQTVLGQVDDVRVATSERLLLVNDSSTIAQVDEAAASSEDGFSAMVRALNTRIADRALFSGAAVDQTTFASADEMLANLSATIPLGSDAPTIEALVDDWFNDPLGGFVTMGYLGDTGAAVEKRIAENASISLDLRGNDPAITNVLKGSALAALSSVLPGLDRDTKTQMLQSAGQQLFAASSDLVGRQARIGFDEGLVENILSENAAQTTSLSIAQNDMINADPFETAAQLQAVQLQLETHFAVTSRLSGLSLLRYI